MGINTHSKLVSFLFSLQRLRRWKETISLVFNPNTEHMMAETFYKIYGVEKTI